MKRAKATVNDKLPRQTSLLPYIEHTPIPDCVLVPEQFFSPPNHTPASRSGVKRLLLAVLQDAVACWFRYRHARSVRGQRLFRETQAWFWATDQNGLFAFERICEHLKLDPDYIRRGLVHWQASRPAQRRPLLRTDPVLSDHHLSFIHP